MSLITAFIAELQHESANTRKMLERLPQSQFDWHPHEKSMSLIRLAGHIAEIPGLFVTQALTQKELDFATFPYKRPVIGSTQDLLTFFEQNRDGALAALQAATQEALEQIWTLRNGPKVLVALPRKVIIRNLGLNHLIHHRGQLSVYLRLAGVSVPGMYGPSADEA